MTRDIVYTPKALRISIFVKNLRFMEIIVISLQVRRQLENRGGEGAFYLLNCW